MRGRSIIDSFNYAVSGIIAALKREKNMRVHYLIALSVIFLSLFFDFSRTEFLLLFFAISLVVVAEMINTALESIVDLITKDYHPLARLSKDISAGAVLIATINSLVVGYLLFFDRLNPYADLLLYKMKKSSIHLTFIALMIVVLLTIGLKAKFFRGKGTHFQGGTVSGHAAVSFCIATIIGFIAEDMLVTTMAFGLAILVGESRIEGKIHSLLEVFLGAVLGTLVGVLIFQIIG